MRVYRFLESLPPFCARCGAAFRLAVRRTVGRGHDDHGFPGTDAARASLEAVLRDGPDIPEQVPLEAAGPCEEERLKGRISTVHAGKGRL